MSQDNMVKMECAECRHITHYTNRNKKTNKERLQLKKHCEWCRKHTVHKETK